MARFNPELSPADHIRTAGDTREIMAAVLQARRFTDRRRTGVVCSRVAYELDQSDLEWLKINSLLQVKINENQWINSVWQRRQPLVHRGSNQKSTVCSTIYHVSIVFICFPSVLPTGLPPTMSFDFSCLQPSLWRSLAVILCRAGTHTFHYKSCHSAIKADRGTRYRIDICWG